MKWKRYLLVTAGILVIFGSTVSCGFVHRPHHRFHPKRITSVVFLRMDNEATRLGLTETQERQYEEMKKRIEREVESDLQDFREMPRETIALLDEEGADLGKVVSDLKTRMAEGEGVRGKYLDYLLEFYDILDERQKDLFMEDLRKELDRHNRFKRTRHWS